MNSEAVDIAIRDVVRERDHSTGIKRLVDEKQRKLGLSIHGACQEVAIRLNRSYEYVRELYDR